METLLISEQDLTIHTPLGGNIDVDRFKSCISDAQVAQLEEVLGETLYEKIKTDYAANTLSGDYLLLHTKYIVPFVIHQAAVEYLLIGAYQIANGGIYKHTPQNGQPVDKSEVDSMVQNQRTKAEMYQQRMEKWLSKNPLAEYTSNSDTIVAPTRRSSVGGWYFGQSGYESKATNNENIYERDFPNG